MTGDIDIRRAGRAGRITLTRPKALNALSHDMCRRIDAALIDWADDPDIALVILDAAGDKAFCAGGDIQSMYAAGQRGDYAFGQEFWRDEYRMNARIAEYTKPIVSFMQGFTMGGGVGLGCHGSHRILGDSSRMAMPECGIGLVPDVGGSLLLARAPGRLGEYIGLAGARMGPGDAIHTGFADHFIPQDAWPDLIATLERDGDPAGLAMAAETPPGAALAQSRDSIDDLFAGSDPHAIRTALADARGELAETARAALDRGSPLSLACTLSIVRTLRDEGAGIRRALDLEYRFTHRAMEHGDFLEGIRAAIIDKDRNPHWRHDADRLPAEDVAQMLAPLGADALDLEDTK